MKHTYRVTLPDGQEATRTTHRTYTHMVAVQNKLTDGDVLRGYAAADGWGSWAWCGRHDLAREQELAAVKCGRKAVIIAVEQPGDKR